jgi:hypothetical protein
MRVCIHRGTKEIGGTCVEVESRNTRIVLDVGLPLDAVDPDEIPLHPICGFETPNASLLVLLFRISERAARGEVMQSQIEAGINRANFAPHLFLPPQVGVPAPLHG